MAASQEPLDATQDHETGSDAASDEASDEGSDASEQPPYSVQQLVAIITDFYQFLATLHYDPADLKFPPSAGWDSAIFPQAIIDSKSEDVVELMKHMPYFRENEKSTHVHYKSKLIDYTNSQQHDHAVSHDQILQDVHGEFSSSDGSAVHHSYLLTIAGGYESGGRNFILDVLHGEITEDVIRWNTCDPVDIEEFFENLEEEFRSLKLIPCPGRETQEAERVPERAEAISEQEVRSQTEQWYPGTDLDWQFVRQTYRQYGWPYQFRRQDAITFIDDFMAREKERRDEWEPAFH